VPRVVFLLVPQLHLLDLAGPAQVFSTAAYLGYPYELRYVADQPDVMTAQGIAFRASVDWPELEPDDLVVVPGWRAPALGRSAPLSEPSVRRLSDHHARGGTVASVCAGADALGRAGRIIHGGRMVGVADRRAVAVRDGCGARCAGCG
jgi:putative intracellular protease/amidase